MKSNNIIFFLTVAVVTITCTSSCYYDKEEFLYPDTICDTATVSYSTTILPVLSSNCLSCHAGTTPSAGIRLDTYEAVSIQAANGRLIGVVTHNASYSPMPKNAAKLSNCNITKIKKWIDAGYPNN